VLIYQDRQQSSQLWLRTRVWQTSCVHIKLLASSFMLSVIGTPFPHLCLRTRMTHLSPLSKRPVAPSFAVIDRSPRAFKYCVFFNSTSSVSTKVSEQCVPVCGDGEGWLDDLPDRLCEVVALDGVLNDGQHLCLNLRNLLWPSLRPVLCAWRKQWCRAFRCCHGSSRCDCVLERIAYVD
jgi:hypothetical protein